MPETNTPARIFGELAATYSDREISDVQIRSGGLIYVHTNRGLEIAESFGIQPPEAVSQMAEALFTSQTAEVWDGLGAANTAEKMWELVKEKRVIDMSCEAGVLGSPVRMRVQIHLSEHGLGITCRWLRAKITQLGITGHRPFDRRQPSGAHSAQVWTGTDHRSHRLWQVNDTGGPAGLGAQEFPEAHRDDRRPHRIPVRLNDGRSQSARTASLLPVIGHTTGGGAGTRQSYQSGLKEVLRKAPHLILIGEIRDRQTMETCIEAAQTGHFVLSTLHTRGAVKTFDRISGVLSQGAAFQAFFTGWEKP
jgi:twitching motility protein PilT